MDKITNRVEKSPLVTLDLETWYPKAPRKVFDIRPFLFEGLILKEKDFRKKLTQFDWQQYKNSYVAITPQEDLIIPKWAYYLVGIHLFKVTLNCVIGDLEALEVEIFNSLFDTYNFDTFKNKPVVIKGCQKINIPDACYLKLITRLKPVVSSIMFGEPCSTVPLFKKKSNL